MNATLLKAIGRIQRGEVDGSLSVYGRIVLTELLIDYMLTDRYGDEENLTLWSMLGFSKEVHLTRRSVVTAFKELDAAGFLIANNTGERGQRIRIALSPKAKNLVRNEGV